MFQNIDSVIYFKLIGIDTFLKTVNYRDELKSLLVKAFAPAGYQITENIKLDPIPENSKYDALFFALNDKKIIYRKGKVTTDRPGAFLSVWQRPSTPVINGNKPIPLHTNQLDYLFIRVEEHFTGESNKESINNLRSGIFIFPTSLLIDKKIVSSNDNKGKTGFRVFPPWSQSRGNEGTQVFSESGKKTQYWQLPYFVEIDGNGLIDSSALNIVFNK